MKPLSRRISEVRTHVAPFTGARIETHEDIYDALRDIVAPFTGARIETCFS